MKTGFIGLGNLGAAIAENLLSEGVELWLYNRTTAKAKALEAKGGRVCGSPKEVAEQCDVVFTIVSDDAALRAIATGPGGLIANGKPGAIHVSMSTILPETARELAKAHAAAGSRYVACPVMARPEAARARRIQYFLSGDAEGIETVRPLLKKSGALRDWPLGEDPGAASAAKLCANFLILSAMESIAECTNLAARSGLDARALMGMLTETYFSSPAYINYSKLILDEAFDPASFSLRLGLKDMRLITGQASAVGAKLPVGETVRAQLAAAEQAGLGEKDVTAVVEMLK